MACYFDCELLDQRKETKEADPRKKQEMTADHTKEKNKRKKVEEQSSHLFIICVRSLTAA